MKRTIEYTEEETKTETVRICDRCGLEANQRRELFDRRRVFKRAKETAERRFKGAPVRTDTVHRFDVTHRHVREMIETALYDMEPLTVCEACHDELFGWVD